MLALHGHCLVQRVAPDIHRLRRDGKHQIEVHIVEAGRAQNVERLEHLFARMDAAKSLQQLFVERLHAHRNAVDSEIAEQFAFVG